jgi:hypothetical protein
MVYHTHKLSRKGSSRVNLSRKCGKRDAPTVEVDELAARIEMIVSGGLSPEGSRDSPGRLGG